MFKHGSYLGLLVLGGTLMALGADFIWGEGEYVNDFQERVHDFFDDDGLIEHNGVQKTHLDEIYAYPVFAGGSILTAWGLYRGFRAWRG